MGVYLNFFYFYLDNNTHQPLVIYGNTFRDLQTGVSLTGIIREVSIKNSTFDNCNTGILLNGNDKGRSTVSVSSCFMVNNVNHFHITMNGFVESERAEITFERNIVVSGNNALVFEGSQSGEQFTWNVDNNSFRNLTGRVLRLRGAGNVTSNVILDNAFLGGILVDVNVRMAIASVVIDRNRFERNAASSVLSFCTLCDSGILLENDFVNNIVINSVITCIYPSLSSNIQQVFNNNIINNKVLNDTISYSAALLITWIPKLDAQGNTFANPDLTYEVVTHQPTLNSSTHLNFSGNTWGTHDTNLINSRILDGCDKGWNPLIRWSESSSSWLFDADERLHGRLNKSVTLQRRTDPYVLAGGLLVPAGVTLTLEPGVTLALEPAASLFIEGTLIAKGSPDDFVQFQRSNNQSRLLPLRLINDRSGYRQLQAFVDSVWRSFCGRGWTADNTDVACRQLGFSGGKSISKYAYFNSHITRVSRREQPVLLSGC